MARKLIAFTLMIILALTAVLFAGCSGNEKPVTSSDKEIKKSVEDEYNKLQDTFTKKPSFDKLCDYVISCKASDKLKINKQTKDYMVMSLPATKSYKQSEKVSIQFPNGLYDINKQNQVLAVLLTTLRVSGAHPAMEIIFTDVSGRNYKGAEKLSEKYLDTSNFIGMIYSPTVSVYNKGAASAYSKITDNYEEVYTDYECSYRFSFSGLKKASIDDADAIDEKASAIKELANFITSAKSSGIIFRIASISGGESADTFASEASAVLVFPSSEKKSFISLYTSSKETFEEEYGKDEPNASFSMITEKKPSKVTKQSDMDNIVNLLYTLDTDVKKDDKKSVASVVNPGKIYLKNGKFDLDICVRDTDKDNMTDTLQGFETACGLFKTKYTLLDSWSPWITHKDSVLVKTLSEQADCGAETTYSQTENVVFKSRKAGLNAVNYGVNLDDGTKSVKALANSFIKLESK